MSEVLIPVCDISPGCGVARVRDRAGRAVAVRSETAVLVGRAVYLRAEVVERWATEQVVRFADGQEVWVPVAEGVAA